MKTNLHIDSSSVGSDLDIKKNKSTLSVFEKYFWGTTIVLAIVVFSLILLGSKAKESSIYVPNVNTKIFSLVDANIDKAFINIYEEGVDRFLDFHYSVVGEYTEMAGAISPDLIDVASKKLLGDNFDTVLQGAQNNIELEYQKRIRQHIDESMDINSNNAMLEQNIKNILNDEVKKDLTFQSGKFGTVIGLRLIGPQIIKSVGSKILTKVVVKTTVKTLTSGGAAVAGVACGPFVVVCAPVIAVTVWFGSDAIILYIDERNNREELKKQIIKEIDKSKNKLKLKVQKYYDDRDSNTHKKIIEIIKERFPKVSIES